MTPEELIAWHAHQIAFLPQTDNVLVKHHREAMHCIERLRADVVHSDLDWERLASGQRRALDPARQQIFDKLAERDALLKLLEIWRTWYARTTHYEFTPPGLLKDTDAAIDAASGKR